MRYWEINGNLSDEQDGLPNYALFENTVCRVKAMFDEVFGAEQLARVSFYVDNATKDSGYTPITTIVLKQIAIIKLRIAPNGHEGQIAYQFAHELTHIVFWTYFGFDKPFATAEEETICSAASLIILKELYPAYFTGYNQHVKTLENDAYRQGADLACSIGYDLYKLKDLIEQFDY